MTVATKYVKGRREVHYRSYVELLIDAEQIASRPQRTLGNWSYGQILRHMALACDSMIDGAPFAMPKPVQWLMRMFLKKSFISKPLSPGFKLPKKASKLLPPETTVEEGLAELRRAISRLESDSHREPNVALGALTNEEWDEFQLRHCEMHMSFVVPDSGVDPATAADRPEHSTTS